jgi:hypothetical protein
MTFKKKASAETVEEVAEVVPEVVQVVVFDSVDSKIKLVTSKEARSPRYKPV